VCTLLANLIGQNCNEIFVPIARTRSP
jgi:hypothetical protein